MFQDYLRQKGVDLPEWVASWDQLGISPSTSTRYNSLVPGTGASSSPMADTDLPEPGAKSDPQVLAAAKAQAADEARQRRLAFLESKAASVSASATSSISDKTTDRVNDWVQASPMPRAADHGLELFTTHDFESGEMMEDLQAAAEEAEVQRQDEASERGQVGTRAAFGRADNDRDGVVSAEEFLEWFAAEMAMTDLDEDSQDPVKPWKKRIAVTIMEAPAIGSSGTVGVALEGFAKLRSRRLQELNDQLEVARKKLEGARRKNLGLQENAARARTLHGVGWQPSPQPRAGGTSPRVRGVVLSVDASSSAEAVHRVVSELTRLQHATTTLEEQNRSLQSTLRVIEELSPRRNAHTDDQELEPEPELEPEAALIQDKQPGKMLPAKVHVMTHYNLMLAEHDLQPAGSAELKGHLSVHGAKVSNMLRRWQPLPVAIAVERTALAHMDDHYQVCVTENSHMPSTPGAWEELQRHTEVHARRVAATARTTPQAETTIVIRFTEPGSIGVALASEHPFDVAWKQADESGDGKLSHRETTNLLRLMGKIDDDTTDADVFKYTAEVMREMRSDEGVISVRDFERWYEAQPVQEVSRIRVETCGVLGARQGLQSGFYLLEVNGTDVRARSIRDVTDMIRNAGRPLTMEFGCVELALQGLGVPAAAAVASQPSSSDTSEAQAIAAQMKTTGERKVAVPAAGVSLAATPKPKKPAMRTMTLIFGKNEELGLVLGSADPLDQMWLHIDKDVDGELGREEVAEVLKMMGCGAGSIGTYSGEYVYIVKATICT